jgi:NADH:ubiquinone oxidoreductase subunit B-like Fe-S oxidoreductase
MERSLHQTSGTGEHKRLVVGWFSFTCCQDSTILLTELLNDHFDEWKRVVEFRHIKALKTKNSLDGLDVAFIEGGIWSESQANEVRQIRENSKYVVAIGACACTGQPSTSRNRFASEQINERIRWYLSHFDYGKEVKKLNEVVQVDDMVRGCPMKAPSFLQILQCVDDAIDLLRTLQLADDKPVRTPATASPGVGVIEAPRGLLYHTAKVDEEGVIEDYDVIVPTAQNQINIENDLKDYFNENLDKDEETVRANAESIIRAYDPCMSCATNFLKIDWIRR